MVRDGRFLGSSVNAPNDANWREGKIRLALELAGSHQLIRASYKPSPDSGASSTYIQYKLTLHVSER